MTNFLKFFDDESYLLDEVGPSFRLTGTLAPVDFWMILIWKANRAKSYHRKRLKKLVPSRRFDDAVAAVASQIFEAESPKEKMEALMTRWKFSVPTASAILTILYPDQFTVYDYRVAEQIELEIDLSYRRFSDELWIDYQNFIEAVKTATPSDLSLRDKDRYLTGKSLRQQAEIDCAVVDK